MLSIIIYFLFILWGGSLMNFYKKLLFLMILESFMLICILMFVTVKEGLSSSYFFLFILSIFLVVESILGISLLIFNTRYSSPMNISMFLI